jgi:hypothetical protein
MREDESKLSVFIGKANHVAGNPDTIAAGKRIGARLTG